TADQGSVVTLVSLCPGAEVEKGITRSLRWRLFLFFQDQDCAHDPAACRKPTNQSPATSRAHAAKLVATLSSELSPQHEKLSISVELGPQIGLQRVGFRASGLLGVRRKV